MLFAVMPTTWLLRWIMLEPIQLPFLVCSILYAMSVKQYKSCISLGNKADIGQKVVLTILSGIFLGLTIFTKVPAFTMIPLVGFAILADSNRNVRITICSLFSVVFQILQRVILFRHRQALCVFSHPLLKHGLTRLTSSPKVGPFSVSHNSLGIRSKSIP